MTKKIKLAVLLLSVTGSSSFAQQISAREILKHSAVSGGNNTAAFSIAGDWSEGFGFSAIGNFGHMLRGNAALGFTARAGSDMVEGLANLGFSLGQNSSIVVSAGRLTENLIYDKSGERESVAQDEFGLSFKGSKFGLNAYLTNSNTTEHFVGANTYGAEFESWTALSNAANLSVGIGYQNLTWADDRSSKNGVTTSVDLRTAPSVAAMLHAFVDYNLTEASYGAGGSWKVGAGTFDVSYTYVDGRVGAIKDDERVQIAFSMPLGDQESPGLQIPGSLVDRTVEGSGTTNLLAEVMRRPKYLPLRVIVKAKATSSGSSGGWCDPTGITPVLVGGWTWLPYEGAYYTKLVTYRPSYLGTYTFYDVNYNLIPNASNISIDNQNINPPNAPWLDHLLWGGNEPNFEATYQSDIFAIFSDGENCRVYRWEGDI